MPDNESGFAALRLELALWKIELNPENAGKFDVIGVGRRDAALTTRPDEGLGHLDFWRN